MKEYDEYAKQSIHIEFNETKVGVDISVDMKATASNTVKMIAILINKIQKEADIPLAEVMSKVIEETIFESVRENKNGEH